MEKPNNFIAYKYNKFNTLIVSARFQIKRMDQSKLSKLSNELFLEFSRYFDVDQIYYSLYELNERLNNLMEQCHPIHLTRETIESLESIFRLINPRQIRCLSILNSV